jgi:hypothetical protein
VATHTKRRGARKSPAPAFDNMNGVDEWPREDP